MRGMGLKVIGVTGERVEPRFPEPNQDFVLVTEPEFPVQGRAGLFERGDGGPATAFWGPAPDPALRVLDTVLHGANRLLNVLGTQLPLKLRGVRRREHPDPGHPVLHRGPDPVRQVHREAQCHAVRRHRSGH